MLLLVLCFVAVLAITVGVGLLAYRRPVLPGGGPLQWGRTLAGRLGAIPAALVALVAGLAIAAAVGLALGYLAKALESSVDKPVFRWINPRVHEGAFFTKANEKLTLLGNNPIIQLTVLVTVIVLGFALRRRWWFVAMIPIALYGEKYLQKFLGKTVDRGHPPTTLGTFPSGGVARILAVWGAVIALVIVLNTTLSRAWRIGLWTGVTAAAVTEAFTRVYLSKHWFTDAAFALPFGALLLVTDVTVVGALSAFGTDRGPARRR